MTIPELETVILLDCELTALGPCLPAPEAERFVSALHFEQRSRQAPTSWRPEPSRVFADRLHCAIHRVVFASFAQILHCRATFCGLRVRTRT